MFHEHRDIVTRLRNEDAHFRRLFDEHNELDHQITRFEEGIEGAADHEIDALKRQKLHLKDQLHALVLREAAA